MRHNHGTDENGVSINCMKIAFDTEYPWVRKYLPGNHWNGLVSTFWYYRYSWSLVRLWSLIFIHLCENLPEGCCCTIRVKVPYEVQTPIAPIKTRKHNPQINSWRSYYALQFSLTRHKFFHDVLSIKYACCHEQRQKISLGSDSQSTSDFFPVLVCRSQLCLLSLPIEIFWRCPWQHAYFINKTSLQNLCCVKLKCKA